MDKIINLSDKDRETLFLQTSSDTNIPFAMVEKDFWVCYVLSKIFSNEELANVLRFKGGTSLSKGYGLIKRFSEDLDLILDKTLILGEEDLFKPSYKKQREFADIISERTASYISGTLKDKIARVLGNPLKIYTDEEYTKINPMYNPVNIDNKSLHVVYPKSSKDGYLRPDILLEIGIMSARTPWENTNTIPYYGANGIQDYVKDYIFDGEYILLAEDGGHFDDFTNSPIAQYITGKSWVNNHAHILQAKPGYNNKYIYYTLVHKDIRKYINGTSRAKLNQEDMWQIKILTSDISTQNKIALFMSAIDEKISQEEYNLFQFYKIKRGLLQQMFI